MTKSSSGYGVLAHHAIVVEVINKKKLKVIHNDGESVVEEENEYDPADLTLVVYSKCSPTEVVLERARAKLGHKYYSSFEHNCEHFATYVKTGKKESKQVQAGITGGAIGVLGGASAGAGAGALLGSVVPVIGTGVGAVAGGLLGAVIGASVGSSTALKSHNKGKK